MTEDELRSLIADMESDRTERTVSFRQDKVGEAVCAFANDLPDHRAPGYLLLGVRDDGTIDKDKITDETLAKIGDLRSNGNILPQPFLTVHPVYHLAEGDVAVVEVHPADYPPVRFKGKCCIRVGPRKATASPQEERVLVEKRARHAKTFDQRDCPGATVKDLNAGLFQTTYLPQAYDAETLESNGRSVEEQLASLGFFDTETQRPTNAGVLLFGDNPLLYLPGAYVQYVRFGGMEMTDTVRLEKQFSGAITTTLVNLENFIRSSVIRERPVANGGFRESRISDYPLWAMRELLMNAIMHRDYQSNAPTYVYHFDDRIEIVNPGSLYGDARPENFPSVSDYRNPVVAQAIKNLGYVNRFNIRVRNAQRSLKENGNPPAEFDFKLVTKFVVKIIGNPAF